MPYALEDLPDLLVRGLQATSAVPYTRKISQSDLAAGNARRGPAVGNTPQFFDSVTLLEALELYGVVRTLKPAASAEIGLASGVSCISILQALEDGGCGHHHACDPFQTSFAAGAGLRNVEASGLSHRLTFYERFPEEVVPGLPALQFAFIDASHLFDLSILDFVLVDKHLEVGGVLGLHDMWMPSVQKLVRYIVTNRAYTICGRPARTPTFRQRTQSRIARFLAHIPRAEAVFAPELLRPLHELGAVTNLVFLRKMSCDTRDWREHQRF